MTSFGAVLHTGAFRSGRRRRLLAAAAVVASAASVSAAFGPLAAPAQAAPPNCALHSLPSFVAQGAGTQQGSVADVIEVGCNPAYAGDTISVSASAALFPMWWTTELVLAVSLCRCDRLQHDRPRSTQPVRPLSPCGAGPTAFPANRCSSLRWNRHRLKRSRPRSRCSQNRKRRWACPLFPAARPRTQPTAAWPRSSRSGSPLPRPGRTFASPAASCTLAALVRPTSSGLDRMRRNLAAAPAN